MQHLVTIVYNVTSGNVINLLATAIPLVSILQVYVPQNSMAPQNIHDTNSSVAGP